MLFLLVCAFISCELLIDVHVHLSVKFSLHKISKWLHDGEMYIIIRAQGRVQDFWKGDSYK